MENTFIKKERKAEEKKRPPFEGKRSYDKMDRFPKTFTPLTKQPAELLVVVLKKPGVQFPYGHDKSPRQPQSDKFCKFHNEYGHYTNDCRNLKMTIEKLIQEGELLEYVRKEAGALKRRKEETTVDVSKESDRAHQSKGPTSKGVIHMIHGGPLGEASNRSRKAYIWEAKSQERHHVFEIESEVSMPEISFGEKDALPMLHPHDDALVITADIEQYEVKHIFVDTGAAVNVIFESCLKQMALHPHITPVNTLLHGFAGEMVMPLGSVDLMVTLGEGEFKVARPTTFLVMQYSSAYNVILGRPALNAFQAVVSTFFMKMKFPVGKNIGQVHGDQVLARECHI